MVYRYEYIFLYFLSLEQHARTNRYQTFSIALLNKQFIFPKSLPVGRIEKTNSDEADMRLLSNE